MGLQINSHYKLLLNEKSFRKPFYIAVWIFGICAYLSIVSFRETPLSINDPFDLCLLVLSVLAGASLVLGPFVITATATSSTVQEVNRDTYQLVHVTPLTNIQLVQGHFLGVLYRRKSWLIAALGLIPNLLARIVSHQADLINCNSGSVIPCYYHPVEVTGTQWALWIILLFELAIGIWGLNLSGASIGVFLGLRWRNAAIAVPIALITISALMYIAFSIYRTLVLNTPRDLPITGANVIALTLFMIIPYLIPFGCVNMTERWARKNSL